MFKTEPEGFEGVPTPINASRGVLSGVINVTLPADLHTSQTITVS